MNRVRAIIFDLDGIIIDSEQLWTQADLQFLKSEGVIIDIKLYEKTIKNLLMGKGFSEGIKVFKKHLGLKGNAQDLHNKRKLTVEKYLKDVSHINGFIKFHQQVKKNYQTAIATSLIRYFLDPITIKFKLNRYFNNHIYSIEDIGFISKPNPAIYLHAAKKLGLKPAECVGIEDSVNGVKAVNAAGMKSIAITTTTEREDLSHANIIVDSYSQIDIKNL